MAWTWLGLGFGLGLGLGSGLGLYGVDHRVDATRGGDGRGERERQVTVEHGEVRQQQR